MQMSWDLGYFIEYADGVHDPGFRMSGVPPFIPMLTIGYRRDDSKPSEPAPDICKSLEVLGHCLEEVLRTTAFVGGTINEDRGEGRFPTRRMA